jgi:hypothetical protein
MTDSRVHTRNNECGTLYIRGHNVHPKILQMFPLFQHNPNMAFYRNKGGRQTAKLTPGYPPDRAGHTNIAVAPNWPPYR